MGVGDRVGVRDGEVARRVLASLRSGIVAVDAGGALAALNEEAQRILGGPPGPAGSWIGRPCSAALAGQPRVAALLLDALQGRWEEPRSELALEPVGGEPRTIGFTLSPVYSGEHTPSPARGHAPSLARGESAAPAWGRGSAPARGDALDELSFGCGASAAPLAEARAVARAGRLEGAAMVFRDLTPYERCGEQERLRDRLAALGQMAAGLAHEIRNPLASMEVLAGLLKRRLGDQPEESALLEELLAELRALADTVTASLDFVKPVEPARAPVDPVELLEESLALARSRVGYGGAIEREYDERCPTLLADGEQLRAVVTNLIVNALEAMAELERPEGHRLRLGLRAVAPEPTGEGARSAEVVLSVADTAAGIPQPLRRKVFYPFFTTKQGGSGLGLATAQKIALSHGGSIELETQEGAGSCVRLRLPAETSEAGARAAGCSVAEGSSGSGGQASARGAFARGAEGSAGSGGQAGARGALSPAAEGSAGSGSGRGGGGAR